MAILLKTASVRISSIQIIQLRVQNKGKVFGKVDTTETYHATLLRCPSAFPLPLLFAAYSRCSACIAAATVALASFSNSTMTNPLDRVWAPGLDSFASNLIYSKNILRWFSGHSENFYFCTKITPWQFCWKQRQSGLVPFKSSKLESKTRAKVFGKVDTTETYQLPQA